MSLLSQAQRQNFIFVLALAEFTENTLTQADQLLEATAEVRQKKFGVENEEFIEGMVGIAVPVNDDKNRIVAALILSTTS
ncbi:MAG: IclR family transcriptional regulator domain-containing protein [Rhodospirillales bacterium]